MKKGKEDHFLEGEKLGITYKGYSFGPPGTKAVPKILYCTTFCTKCSVQYICVQGTVSIRMISCKEMKQEHKTTTNYSSF